MNSKEINIQKQQIFRSLKEGDLKNAFDILNRLVVHTQDWRLTETISELETNYKYMLHYLFEGLEDPERNNVYYNIIKSLYVLTEDTTDSLLLYESQNYLFERLRIDALKKESFADYSLMLKEQSSSAVLIDLLESGEEKTRKIKESAVKRERIAIQLFNSVFSAPRANKQTIAEYRDFISSLDIPSREKALFISALTLNISHRFDANKIEILISATQSELLQVRVRAFLGLVITLYIYDERWILYPELKGKIEALSEDPSFRKSILLVIIQLIRARDTERISKKVTEEILPEMMKFSKLSGKRLNMEDLMNDSDFMDKNPDWKKDIDDAGLTKKLQEYSELQMEGADVFHSTFASLKSYPFFSEISNWFLPFDKNYSEISDLFPEENGTSLLDMAIVKSGHMCNSDKYSFCLSLLQIPSSQREAMKMRMGAESEELKQMQKDAQATNPQIDDEVASNQYIQDLYRFYKLNRQKDSFLDIFKLELDFYNKSTIAPLISDTESMNKIANYCFDKNNFQIALGIYNQLIENKKDTETTWQKIGYCYQMSDNKAKALEAYIHADLLSPDKTWTLKRIALLYKSLNQSQKALEYYLKISRLTPDNINIELNIGHCYLELKEYEKALNYYFKVEMLDNKSNRAHRAIAWTALLLKKYNLAEKYYTTILQNSPTMHDYLNAGHLYLILKKMNKALELYENAAMQADNMEQVKNLINADKETLVSSGVEPNLFPFLIDKIKYILD